MRVEAGADFIDFIEHVFDLKEPKKTNFPGYDFKIFEDIESQIIKLPIVTIYLTFEPDEATLSQIGQRAKKTFNKLLIFDIKYDPRLIAGAALVCKGVYRDYSLRSKIEEKRLIILNNFKKFLK